MRSITWNVKQLSYILYLNVFEDIHWFKDKSAPHRKQFISEVVPSIWQSPAAHSINVVCELHSADSIIVTCLILFVQLAGKLLKTIDFKFFKDVGLSRLHLLLLFDLTNKSLAATIEKNSRGCEGVKKVHLLFLLDLLHHSLNELLASKQGHDTRTPSCPFYIIFKLQSPRFCVFLEDTIQANCVCVLLSHCHNPASASFLPNHANHTVEHI